jgi:hypothetical protein
MYVLPTFGENKHVHNTSIVCLYVDIVGDLLTYSIVKELCFMVN